MYRRSSAPLAHARRPLPARSSATRSVAGRDVVFTPGRRRLRSRVQLPLLAGVATLGFVLVSIVDPYSGAYAAETNAAADPRAAQTYTASGQMSQGDVRDGYGLTKPAPPPPAAPPASSGKKASGSAPSAGIPDPGSAQAIAHDMVLARGWGEDQYSCLVALWNKESHWRVNAGNTSSGAYGIPQALPGSKMASAGPNWQTDAATQISWGLGYISGRYGTPCAAWANSQAKNWY